MPKAQEDGINTSAGKPRAPLDYGDRISAGKFRIRPTKFFGFCIIEELIAHRSEWGGPVVHSWVRVCQFRKLEILTKSDGSCVTVETPIAFPFKPEGE